ncbi:MAG: sodium-dependent transporter [Clostridiales bacterium]|nr:sodium-dependent transporter [Clostridiales bacterium]
MDNNNVQRDGFSSRLGILFAAAGSAIGLGNIWKFPYITGVYGGAAFILVYLLCIALIGLPIMLSEFTIGRRAQKNAIGSFKTLKPNSPWFLTGWMGFIAAFSILSFYGVVAGWTVDYIVKAITGAYVGLDADAIGGLFVGLISNPVMTVVYQLIFMILTGLIVYGGIKDGIEKYSKILMPLLLVIIVILDVRAVTLPGASEGINFLFSPDFSALSAEAVLVALGHAFFSLSLGMGTMITYGSYIGKKEDLGSMALQVTIADTVIALLAGLAIFPAVFAFGVEPAAGPGLVFITLPNVFNQMAGGMIWGVLFFLLLAVAALTSAISILEVVVAYFAEELKMPRHKATILATAAISFVGALAGLSYTSVLGNVLIPLPGFGSLVIFDWLDMLSANYLLPLGGLFISIFVGWIMKKEDVIDEVSNSGAIKISWFGAFMILAKVVAPIMIAIVFLNGIGIFKF